MKQQIWEGVKSAVIVLLICSLLLLTVLGLPADMIRDTPWLSSILQPFATVLGLPAAELAYVEQAQPVSDAAQPLAISVHNSAGRYTARWDFEALDEAYGSLGGMLGEALDTASDFTQVTEWELQKALSRESVSMEYGFLLPAQVLASWLDANMDGHVPAASLYILAVDGDKTMLYLRGETCSRSETRVDPAHLTEVLEQYRPDGSQYSFEADSHLQALSLCPQQVPALQNATVTSPCDTRYTETLATALGFNAYDANRYTDSSGITYFSESNRSLQISAAGSVWLTAFAQDRSRSMPGDTAELVEEARNMVEQAMGTVSGDARVYLSGVTVEEEQTVCTFDYVLDGVPVFCGKEGAAKVAFTGQMLTELKLQVLNFSFNEGRLQVLPPAQAMAILPAGGELRLSYYYSYGGELSAGWRS